MDFIRGKKTSGVGESRGRPRRCAGSGRERPAVIGKPSRGEGTPRACLPDELRRVVDASHWRLRHHVRAQVHHRDRPHCHDRRHAERGHYGHQSVVFEHVFGIVWRLTAAAILLATLGVVVRDLKAVVMQFETPKYLMRMAYGVEQHHDQQKKSVGADKRHLRWDG